MVLFFSVLGLSVLCGLVGLLAHPIRFALFIIPAALVIFLGYLGLSYALEIGDLNIRVFDVSVRSLPFAVAHLDWPSLKIYLAGSALGGFLLAGFLTFLKLGE